MCDREPTQLPQELARLASAEVAGSTQQRHRVGRPSHGPPPRGVGPLTRPVHHKRGRNPGWSSRRLLDVVLVAVGRVHAVRRDDGRRVVIVVRVTFCSAHLSRRAIPHLASSSQPPSSSRLASAGGRQPLAWSASDVWIVPSVRCVQQAKTVSTTIASAVVAAMARLMTARQRRRTSRFGASVHCKKCHWSGPVSSRCHHSSTYPQPHVTETGSQPTPHRHSSFSRQVIVVQLGEVRCTHRADGGRPATPRSYVTWNSPQCAMSETANRPVPSS